MEGKLIARNTPNQVASMLGKETGVEVSSAAIKEEKYSWGQVKSYCTPSSGFRCAYVMEPENDKKITVVLRYSSSVPLRFDFAKVIFLTK